MAQQDVLREFVVALGWQNDEIGLRKAFGHIEKLEKNLVGIVAAAEAASLAVVASLAKMAEGFERSYYASSRSGASVREMRNFQFAASQMGSSAEEASAAVEGLSAKMRKNPGYANVLRQLGATDVNDAVKSLEQIAPRLAKMPLFQAEQFGDQLGIPEKLLLAMRQVEEFRKQEGTNDQKTGLFGVDLEKAAKDGKDLTQRLRDVRSSIGLITDAAASPLFQKLDGPLKSLNDFLVEHGKDIADAIGKVAGVIADLSLKLIDVTPKVADFLAKMVGDDIKSAAPLWKPLADVFGRILDYVLRILDAMKAPAWKFFTNPGGLGADAGKAVDSFEDKDFDGKEKPGEFTLKNSWNWFKNKLGIGGGGSGKDIPAGKPVSLTANQQEAYGAARAAGLNDKAAKALVANMSGEGLSVPHNVHWDGTHYAHGIVQWDDDRSAAIKAKFGKMPNEMSVAEQTQAAIWEINTNPRYAATRRALAGDNSGAMIDALVRNYESPADKESAIARRSQIYAGLGKLGAAPKTPPAGGYVPRHDGSPGSVPVPKIVPSPTGGASLNLDSTRSLFNARPLGANHVSNDNRSTNINHAPNITIHGVTDPKKAADLAHDAMVRASNNSVLLRSVSTAIG